MLTAAQTLQAEAEDLRGKWEDSRVQAKNDQQMICWLNSQVCRANTQHVHPGTALRANVAPTTGLGSTAGCHSCQALCYQSKGASGGWQVNDAQLHGTLGTKYTPYSPGLLGITAATIPALYGSDLDAMLPLRYQCCKG